MPRPEGKFRTERHPLCPECEYDLIATVDAGHRTCPECGLEFSLYELLNNTLPGDWTIARGFRRVLLRCVARGVIFVPTWMLIHAINLFLVDRVSAFVVPFLTALAGLLTGYYTVRRISDVAGFYTSYFLPICWISIAIYMTGALLLMHLMEPLAGVWWLIYCMFGLLPALIWSFKMLWLGD